MNRLSIPRCASTAQFRECCPPSRMEGGAAEFSGCQRCQESSDCLNERPEKHGGSSRRNVLPVGHKCVPPSFRRLQYSLPFGELQGQPTSLNYMRNTPPSKRGLP